MASLLPSNGVLFDIQGQAPSPSKDFVQFIITLKETQSVYLDQLTSAVWRIPYLGWTTKSLRITMLHNDQTIWRSWRITLRNDYKRLLPSEQKEPVEDFAHDERLQFDVGKTFGDNILEYARRLCKGQIDYLVRMPKPLQIYIASFLDLEDVAMLSQTCKAMYEICSAEALWEQIFHHHCDTVTDEMTSLALDMGWKQMFFTNKLQLQVKLRRHQQKRTSPDGGSTFITEEVASNPEL
ncbi:F-box only protein 36 [Holothuria leucospilota]|uniref:F-box only protein 36 n=1 Tax=Holothuria leucospilota TaxID=206669 RepID=A0A9Q1BNX7_HOLLE|nr:F-box only protein 36 [Holothuria leucospilota]